MTWSTTATTSTLCPHGLVLGLRTDGCTHHTIRDRESAEGAQPEREPWVMSGVTELGDQSLRRAFARLLEASRVPMARASAARPLPRCHGSPLPLGSATGGRPQGRGPRRTCPHVSGRTGGVLCSEAPSRLPPPSHASTGCVLVQGVACS